MNPAAARRERDAAEPSAVPRGPRARLRGAAADVGVLLASLVVTACASHPRVMTPPRRAPSWLVGAGDVRLYAAVERPGGYPRCVLYFVLGPEVTAEPAYPRLARAALARGYALVTLHARGTGYSDGLPGDIRDYDDILDDLRLGLGHTSATAAGRPVFLFGHSVGATLALAVAASAGRELGGLLLVNPAYKLRHGEGMGPSFKDYLAFAFNAVFRRAALTVDMNRDPGAAKFAPDRAEGEAMQRDPLVVRYFSLRMLSAQRRVMTRAPRNAAAVVAPVLLVEGAHDALVDPAGNDVILVAARTRDKQKLVAPLGGHGSSAVETMVEPILEWIDARCRGTEERGT